MRRSYTLILVGTALVALTSALGVFQFVYKPALIKEIITKAPQPVMTVAVSPAIASKWQSSMDSVGTLRAVQGIDVAPQIGGVIRAVHFESGQDVVAGELLVELDDSVEQADKLSSEATLKNAEAALDRQRMLVGGGVTTKAAFDAAQSQRDTAFAALERSKALIAQKKLYAAFSGRVGLRKVDAGQYITAGTAVATLQNLNPIFVDFPVPEKFLSSLKSGQTVSVRVDSRPDRIYTGQISSLDARVNPDTRSILIRASIENTDKSLLPGMFANLTLFVDKPQAVLTLPRTAVTASLQGDFVYVVKVDTTVTPSATSAQNWVVERRSVKVGEVRDEHVSILGGLAEGELVVSQGQNKLSPGARVKMDSSLSLPNAPSVRPKL